MSPEIFNDLREYIARVEELGECKVMEGVDWNLEMGVISELYVKTPDPPLLIFDKIKGYEPGYRVVSNLMVTPRRAALVLGLPLEARGIQLVKAWRERVREIKLIPPVEVSTGPVKENIQAGDDVDLYKFPVPKWHELDGGRYIGTASMVIMRDPDDGWVNVGTYRVQVHDRDTATIYIGPGQHGDIIRKRYWSKGLSCPVAVSVGQDPLLWSVSTTSIPFGMPEYDYTGGLRNAPVEVVRGEVTGLPIPATAEIVLEGEILPPEVETRMEGPFGEWTGYYAGGSRPEAAFKVKRILHRNNPIIMGASPLGGPDRIDKFIKGAVTAWEELDRQVPNVKGVWLGFIGGHNFIVTISIKQSYAGHAKQAALAAAGCWGVLLRGKFIIVVDDDIDPSNISEVLWAVASRCDPAESIDIVRGTRSDLLNPTVSPEQRHLGDITKSVALIIACKPFHWIDEFPKSIYSSPELLDQVNKRWQIIVENHPL